MPGQRWARTVDGRYHVLLHADQTAEITNERGTTLVGRLPLFEIAVRLLDLGVDTADLVSDDVT